MGLEAHLRGGGVCESIPGSLKEFRQVLLSFNPTMFGA